MRPSERRRSCSISGTRTTVKARVLPARNRSRALSMERASEPSVFDAFGLIIPIAGANDVVSDAQLGKLTVEDTAQWTSLITCHDLETFLLLLADPAHQARSIKSLDWFRRRAIHLGRDHILHGMRVNADFQYGFGLRLGNCAVTMFLLIHRADSLRCLGTACLPSCFLAQKYKLKLTLTFCRTRNTLAGCVRKQCGVESWLPHRFGRLL
jgi:hypothetical protein